ncbi:putative copper resistance protein D [Halobacillus karajensis]|uniref:copper resistance D family protein n=1 Tax=Halobacillus karajensis TaxID=195088 RepID=UPI0008A79BDC|nr:CopD family protein [Halobacillus karajensis]SEI00499.1 putative copper resistance protein D [Halobacillus karajensis]
MIYALTNGGLYLCLSILLGAGILALVPEERKVKLAIPGKAWFLFTLGIPVFAMVPVIELATSLQAYREGGWLSSLTYVLTNIEGGRAWVLLLLLALLHMLIINAIHRKRVAFALSLLVVIAMIVLQSLIGHSASMNSVQGAVFHTIHFLTVGCWSGILLVASFFVTEEGNWSNFVGWFTKVAVGCMVWIALTGISMSLTLTENLISSWMFPYGQALLIKHLLFIILLLFAFINGFLMKKLVENRPSFSPKRWWKAESLLVLFVYTATGYMTEQEPPRDISQMMSEHEPSFLFRSFTVMDGYGPLVFAPNMLSFLFFIIAGAFLYLAWLMVKRNTVAAALIVSLMIVCSLYLSFMSSVELQ